MQHWEGESTSGGYGGQRYRGTSPPPKHPRISQGWSRDRFRHRGGMEPALGSLRVPIQAGGKRFPGGGFTRLAPAHTAAHCRVGSVALADTRGVRCLTLCTRTAGERRPGTTVPSPAWHHGDGHATPPAQTPVPPLHPAPGAVTAQHPAPPTTLGSGHAGTRHHWAEPVNGMERTEGEKPELP